MASPVLHGIAAPLHLGFPGSTSLIKLPVVSVLPGGTLATLQGQLHTAQLLHHKVELMLKSLILFQSCSLCQNMEQFKRNRENASVEPA